MKIDFEGKGDHLGALRIFLKFNECIKVEIIQKSFINLQ